MYDKVPFPISLSKLNIINLPNIFTNISLQMVSHYFHMHFPDYQSSGMSSHVFIMLISPLGNVLYYESIFYKYFIIYCSI